MGKVTRRQFLEEVIDAPPQATDLKNDPVFQKYVNKKLPRGSAAKTTGSLNNYTGAWTETQVIHLLRRTTFGMKPADITTLMGMSMSAAVDYILNNIPAAPAPPVNNYDTATYTDPTGVLPGQTWVNAAYGDGTVNGKRIQSLKSWWTGKMLNQNLSILEKMTLFWHNHFAVEFDTVGDARYSYQYTALLRQHALGNFKTLTKDITINTAMLRYLNGYLNTKNAPDENYARELQELFTVGKFNTPNYVEADVQAAAKVLTGWRVNSTTMTSFFDSTKHDTTNKQFSSFYNNTVITGQTGAAGANETDALITMIFAKTETARYLCSRLYRYFVYYVIDNAVQANIIDQMATILIANNWNVKPVISALLKSDHFFEMESRSCYIRTPLDYIIGTFRTFGVTLPSNFTDAKNYAVWNYLRSYGALLAQDLGDPPNVAAWPAFYQSPEYYEVWINSNTLPKRMAFTDMMMNTGFTASTGSTIKVDVLQFAQAYPNVSDPDMMVAYCCKLLLGLDVSTTFKNSLKGILLSGQSSNYYWTQAWTDYINNPNATNTGIVKTRLISLLTTITRLAEHQLC